MPFHTYTRPTDYVYLFPTARSFIYGDSDLVAGNVVVQAGYNGTVREAGSNRLDDPDVYLNQSNYVAYPDVAPLGVSWDCAQQVWGVIGGKIYLSTAVAPPTSIRVACMRIHDNGFDHNDVSVDVSTSFGIAGITHHAQSDNSMIGTYLDPVSLKVKAANIVGQAVSTVLFTGTTTFTLGQTYRLRVAENSSGVVSVYLNGNLEGTYDLTGVLVNGQPAATTRGIGLIQTETTARFANLYVAPAAASNATTITVRNYDGAIIYTSAVSALADPTLITVPDSVLKQRSNRGPYGWYRMYVTGPDHGDGQWGTAYGDCAFCRIPTVAAGFNANTVVNQPSPGISDQGIDEYARGVMAPGTVRYNLSNRTPMAQANLDNTEVYVGAPILKTRWVDNALSLRPRKIVGAFSNGTTGLEASIVTPTVNALKASIKAWESRNEPNFYTDPTTWVNTELIPFYNAVKAEDATASVLGPGTVSFNAGGIGWLAGFFSAGGGNYVDALSVHAYNCTNGDIAFARKTLTSLKQTMAAASFSKPIYQTEQGFAWEYAGLIYPRYSGRWTALMWFMAELYGLPVDNNSYWYDSPIGFDSFPTFWTNATGIGPQPVPIRTMVAEIGNRTLTAQFDFGTYGNPLYAGGTWTAADGSKTVGLMAASYGQRDLFLDVTGTSSLTCVDTWGNTFTLNSSSGRVTFPISEMPQWVRCPVGVTVTPTALGLTTNLGLSATVTSDAVSNSPPNSTTTTTLINNDIYEIGVYDGSASPYTIQDPVFPMTVTLTWGAAQTINRVVLNAYAPWNLNGVPTAFTIDTWDGATWTTRYTKTAPSSKSFAFASGAARCTFETYFDEPYVFDAAFTAVSTTKIRVVITDATVQSGEAGAYDALWGAWGTGTPKCVTIREIQAFNASDPAAPPTPGVTRLRNPSMGGVTG